MWKKAHELTLDVYQITKSFPAEERYRLTDQLCRAMASVPANIAEGTGRKSRAEYLQFLYQARGSLEEARYHLILARDLGYISSEKQSQLNDRCSEVGRMLNGLIRSLKQQARN